MNEVHSPKKPLIFYYMVAMLLVMLFNFIAMPWLSQYQIQEVEWTSFMDRSFFLLGRDPTGISSLNWYVFYG